jgi:hypothetical protein
MKKVILSMSLVLLILMSVGAIALAANGYEIGWYSISGGGGQVTSYTGVYTISASVGQPVVGGVTQNETEVCSGFWCGVWSIVHIFLPFIQP